MLVRPLSTVDNTRDYARVSHSRQYSGLTITWTLISKQNVTKKNQETNSENVRRSTFELLLKRSEWRSRSNGRCQEHGAMYVAGHNFVRGQENLGAKNNFWGQLLTLLRISWNASRFNCHISQYCCIYMYTRKIRYSWSMLLRIALNFNANIAKSVKATSVSIAWACFLWMRQ